MNKIINILCNFCEWLICLTFDLLVLNKNGSFSSLSNLHDKDVLLDKKKYHFTGKYTCDTDITQYLAIVDKIKRLDIFKLKDDDPGWNAVIHKNKTLVQQDDLVAITTAVVGETLYTTSYEKIAVLEETENMLILCITTCSENIINGYYRFQLKYDIDKQQILLIYSKVQTFTSLMLRFLAKLNEDTYIEYNKVSVMNTFNHLFDSNIFLKKDVEYEYK